MRKLTDPVKQYVEQSGLQEDGQSAIDEFKWKFYTVTHSELITISKWASKLLPVVSCISGMLFLQEILSALPDFAAIIISLILFSLWELAKNAIASSTFKGYFSNRSEFKAMAAVTLILVAGSMFCSVSGAEIIFERVDNQKEEIEQKYTNIREGLQAKHDETIAELKADKQKFEDNNQVWINNKVGSKFNHKLSDQLVVYESRIDSAKSEFRASRKELKTQESTELKEAAKDSGFNAWVFIMIAFIIDAAIIISVFFPIMARFRFAKEWQRMKGEGQVIKMDFESLANLLAITGMQDMQQLAASAQQSTQIGFKGALNTSQTASHTGAASTFKVPLKNKATKGSDYWTKYPNLCTALQQVNAGELDVTRKSLAGKYKVSVDTVYRVQKAILV